MKLYLIKFKNMKLSPKSFVSVGTSVPILYAFTRKKDAKDYIDSYFRDDRKFEIITVTVEP